MGPNRGSARSFPVGGPDCPFESHSLSLFWGHFQVQGLLRRWAGDGGSQRPWRP